MTSKILYSIAIIFLIISFFKDKKKTKTAIITGLKSFENMKSHERLESPEKSKKKKKKKKK